MTVDVIDLAPRQVTQAERQRANREADKLVEDAEQKLKEASRERDKAAKAFADAEGRHESIRYRELHPTPEQRGEIHAAAHQVRTAKAELAKADAAYIIAERERRDVAAEEAYIREGPDVDAKQAAEQARQQARLRLKRLASIYIGALAVAIERSWLLDVPMPDDWRVDDEAMVPGDTYTRLLNVADNPNGDVVAKVNAVLPGGHFTGSFDPPVIQARAVGVAYVNDLPALALAISELATALRDA